MVFFSVVPALLTAPQMDLLTSCALATAWFVADEVVPPDEAEVAVVRGLKQGLK